MLRTSGGLFPRWKTQVRVFSFALSMTKEQKDSQSGSTVTFEVPTPHLAKSPSRYFPRSSPATLPMKSTLTPSPAPSLAAATRPVAVGPPPTDFISSALSLVSSVGYSGSMINVSNTFAPIPVIFFIIVSFVPLFKQPEIVWRSVHIRSDSGYLFHSYSALPSAPRSLIFSSAKALTFFIASFMKRSIAMRLLEVSKTLSRKE